VKSFKIFLLNIYYYYYDQMNDSVIGRKCGRQCGGEKGYQIPSGETI
jgi:hypothetical protein